MRETQGENRVRATRRERMRERERERERDRDRDREIYRYIYSLRNEIASATFTTILREVDITS